MPRALKLYAHRGSRPRELFVVRHVDGRRARSLVPIACASTPADPDTELHLAIARARTELGLCARCEHILRSSRRVAIDLQRELVYCLDCWADLTHAVDVQRKDSLQ
jgi:hypothetical protein